MSLSILRREPVETLSSRPLHLRDVLLRIREREARKRERRAYWRRFFGQDRAGSQAFDKSNEDYARSTAIAEAIIGAGVVLFLVSLLACCAWMALL